MTSNHKLLSPDEVVVGNFHEFMEAIDAEFARRRVPIPDRGLDAYWAALGRCGISAGIPSDDDRRLGTDMAVLYDAIANWMERRYGDRLKIHLGPGSTVILLRAAVWRIRIPLFYGMCRVVAIRPGEAWSTPALNVLDCLVGATDEFKRTLREEECIRVGECFVRSAAVLMDLMDASDLALLGRAYADLQTAGEHLLSDSPEVGLSRWSSLQASEKAIKQLIKDRGGKSLRTHDLGVLAVTAEGLGLTRLDRSALAQAQCWPGIRYGEGAEGIEGGVDALEAAYSIVAAVLHALQLGRVAPRGDEKCLSGPIDWRGKYTGSRPQ